MNADQTQQVMNHLALVFKHEIDPSFGGPEKQKILNEIHDTKAPYPASVGMTCGLPTPGPGTEQPVKYELTIPKLDQKEFDDVMDKFKKKFPSETLFERPEHTFDGTKYRC